MTTDRAPEIQPMGTPNPRSVKFLTDRTLVPVGSADFRPTPCCKCHFEREFAIGGLIRFARRHQIGEFPRCHPTRGGFTDLSIHGFNKSSAKPVHCGNG